MGYPGRAEGFGLSWNVPWDYFISHPEGFNNQPWNIYGLSINPNLPWSFILQHPDGIDGKPWNSYGLSLNINLDWDYVSSHPEGFGNEPWIWTAKRVCIIEKLISSLVLCFAASQWP